METTMNSASFLIMWPPTPPAISGILSSRQHEAHDWVQEQTVVHSPVYAPSQYQQKSRQHRQKKDPKLLRQLLNHPHTLTPINPSSKIRSKHPRNRHNNSLK